MSDEDRIKEGITSVVVEIKLENCSAESEWITSALT